MSVSNEDYVQIVLRTPLLCASVGGMKTILLAAALGLALMTCPIQAKCPIHKGFNGVYHHDEYVDGVHVKYYKCYSTGHLFGIAC